MRKVFTDELPRFIWVGKECIDWKLCIGRRVRFIYDDIEGWVEIINYYKKSSHIIVKYLELEYKLPINTFKDGKLSGVLKIRTIGFKIEIGTNFIDSKRNIIITDKNYRKDKNNINRKWYKYICNKCGWTEGWIEESALLGQNQGCSVCCNTPRTVIVGINTIWDKARWMCDLGISEQDAKTHTYGSGDKVKVTCPDCKKTKTIRISDVYKKHSILCNCSDKTSYPNKFAYSLLDQLNEIYKFEHLEHEYSPDWIKPKRYDNYFIYNGKEYILEMDGGFHFNDNKMSGQSKEQSKTIDDYKDLKARERGIKVIRIDCMKSNLEYIKQNIIVELGSIFNLTNIDWLEIERFALSNLVKQACNYKKNNINMTTNDISKIMGFTYSTIIKYLKQGYQLGWCNYNAKEELKKSVAKNGKLNSKRVEVFKDTTSLGIFNSYADLSRQSESLFGVSFSISSISLVCLGIQPKCKGFIFKWIDIESFTEQEVC